MKTYSTALENYRAALREFYQIDLLSFHVRDRTTGNLVWYHFSSRDENETIQVRNQSTGALEYRDYFGGGHIISLPNLVRSEGTTVQNFTIKLSGTSQQVQDMIQGYDCRDAVIEWHIGEGADDTGLMIDTPVCEFEGFVNSADRDDEPISDTDAPAESSFSLAIVGHKSALQQPNLDLRSYEVGTDRSGDEIFLYAPESNTWDVLWGKAGKKHKKDDNGSGRNPSPNPNPGWNDHTR